MRRQRLFTATAVASAAALALAGCAGGGSEPASDGGDEAKTVSVWISGDTNVQALWEETLIPAFEEANPDFTVEVNLDLHGENDSQTVAKLQAATDQDEEPDMDVMDGGLVQQAALAGLLVEPTVSDIPALANISDTVLEAGGDGGIPYRGSSVLLAYDTEKVPNPPQTLDELLTWIKDNPGRFTYNTPDSGGSGQSFVTTVLDQYVPDDVRDRMVVEPVENPETYWEEGFEELASLNEYIFQEGVYPNGNTQSLELLSSGETWMAPVWSDQFISGQKSGLIPEHYSYTQIDDPSFTGGAAYLGIPEASPRQEEAMTLVNWVLSPEAQALVAEGISGYPVIDLALLPEDVQTQFEDANIETLRLPYFGANSQELNRIWSERVPG